MSYKTILVHVDDTRNVEARMEIAARLAMLDDAHLIGTATTGISRFLFDAVVTDSAAAGVTPYLEILRHRAEKMLVAFDEVIRRTGITSFEKRLIDDEAVAGISLQGRYCDLVVLGQYDPDGPAPAVDAGMPEYVAMNSGCPVLIVPYATPLKRTGNRVLVAWNASVEAKKAVYNALPLLRRASIVEVVVFNPESHADVHGQEAGADMATYLARHGVNVDVMQESVGTNVGDALLLLATSLNSDLIVMGCYGHSRFREVLLGGVTRTILQSMTVPVLMSH